MPAAVVEKVKLKPLRSRLVVRLSRLVLAAMFALALSSLPTTADAAGEPAIVETDTPFPFTFESCAEGLATGTGTFHSKVQFYTDGERLHVAVAVHITNATATTANGSVYQFLYQNTGSQNGQVADFAPFSATFLEYTKLTRKGEITLGGLSVPDDLKLRFFSHFTVNANGSITSDKLVDVGIECN